MKSNELIHRYLLGIASDDDVQELESRLQGDEALQDELLLQAELDAHLRQETQTGSGAHKEPKANAQQQSPNVWKWVSGVSTLAASILLMLFALSFPPQKNAMAFPSLGDLSLYVLRTEGSIWVAAGTGNLDMLRGELQNGVPVDAKLYEDLTPLHVSALFGQTDAAQLLQTKGADITATNGEGNTALHMAAFLGNTDVVQVLLSAGADPAHRNGLGFSSADLVATTWTDELEEYLRVVEQKLHTTLDLDRIREERPKILNLLVSANESDDEGVPATSIFQAAIVGNVAAIKQHVAAGTDLNQTEDVGGCTPLMLATIFGHAEVAKSLIEAGADIEIRNKSQGTALHQACFFCRPEIVMLLLEAGADQTKVNFSKLTPLESVTKDLNSEWKAVYTHAFESLNLDLDFDDIQVARETIVEIFANEKGKE